MPLTVNGVPMKIYARHVHTGENLTDGSNTENRQLKSSNMYPRKTRRPRPPRQQPIRRNIFPAPGRTRPR